MSQPYEEILQRLGRIEPEEVWLLLGEVQGRIRTLPGHKISEFEPVGTLTGNRPDWVSELRDEWKNEA